MNPNLPINQQNIDDLNEQDLHEQAGLVFNGYDEDGLKEWIGSDAKWKRYDDLLTQQLADSEQII
jgi:hypothetical protein